MNGDTPLSHISTEASKLAFPASIAGATLLGLSLPEWVYVTAIASAVISFAFTAWKWGCAIRDRRAGVRLAPDETS